MTERAEPARPGAKDRGQFQAVLERWMAARGVAAEGRVLVLGASAADASVLAAVGFSDVTLSQHEAAVGGGMLALDAEAMALPDGAFDIVFAHEVLHHCRSPHRAVCEMMRVARRHVLFLEPNDSAFMRLLVRLGFSFPYEIGAVVDHGYAHGGVRNTGVPNYVFRWCAREVRKLVDAFLPERLVRVDADPYWDFNLDAASIDDRRETRLGMLTGVLGTERFLRLLRFVQAVANRVPLLRPQGNKFFCAITAGEALRPWLRWEEGRIVFNRAFRA